MSDAPERIWAFYAPEIEEDNPQCTIVAGDGPMHGAQPYIRADRIEELEGEAEGAAAIIATERAEVLALRQKLEKAKEALLNIDCKLTNMQPKIANGLLDEVQLAWVDQYVDPCISE